MEPRPRKPQLSVLQRRHVERAREVAAASAQSIAADYDRIDPDDPDQAYPYALGVTRSVVGSLLDIIGDLTGEPELDAKLSPPAALSDAERDEAVMPPGHQLPAGEVTGWDEPLPPYHAKGGERCMSKDAELGYFCTAQRGHAGPLHVAYGFDEEVLCGWPVDAEVPAGSDAR